MSHQKIVLVGDQIRNKTNVGHHYAKTYRMSIAYSCAFSKRVFFMINMLTYLLLLFKSICKTYNL